MSAPSSSSSRPCLIASAGSNHSPPSEKESGVTLTTPITRVRPGCGRPGDGGSGFTRTTLCCCFRAALACYRGERARPTRLLGRVAAPRTGRPAHPAGRSRRRKALCWWPPASRRHCRRGRAAAVEEYQSSSTAARRNRSADPPGPTRAPLRWSGERAHRRRRARPYLATPATSDRITGQSFRPLVGRATRRLTDPPNNRIYAVDLGVGRTPAPQRAFAEIRRCKIPNWPGTGRSWSAA